jgi:hypothetical protein
MSGIRAGGLPKNDRAKRSAKMNGARNNISRISAGQRGTAVKVDSANMVRNFRQFQK